MMAAQHTRRFQLLLASSQPVSLWRTGIGLTALLVCTLSMRPAWSVVDPSLLTGTTFERATDSVSLGLPTMGGGPSLLEQHEEQQQGEAILRELRRTAPLLNDPWVQEELARVFTRISAQAGLKKPVALLLIRDPQINAFATPGGLVAVYSGLIAQAESMDEVAGVLAHEVAHVSQRHFSRRQFDLRNNKWLSLGGMVAGILLAKQDSDAGAAVMTGSQAAAISQQLSYSRDQEREADRVGMQLMRAAGFAPQGMPDFFDIMQRSNGNHGFLPDFVLTHPLTLERTSEAHLRAAQFKAQAPTPAELTHFRLLQGQINALSGQLSINSVRVLAERDDVAATTLATLYRLNGRFNEARALLGRLQKAHPTWSLLPLIAAEVELDEGKPQAALAIIEPVYRLTPTSKPLALLMVRAWIDQQQSPQAIDLLQDLSRDSPTDLMVWQLLYSAASRLPNDTPDKAISVLRYRAESQFWSGQVDDGIVSLERAQTLARTGGWLYAKISQRLNTMREDRKVKLG